VIKPASDPAPGKKERWIGFGFQGLPFALQPTDIRQRLQADPDRIHIRLQEA
jgi:hypothetical protein